MSAIASAVRRFLDSQHHINPARYHANGDTDCEKLLSDTQLHLETMDNMSVDRQQLATIMSTDPTLHAHAIFGRAPTSVSSGKKKSAPAPRHPHAELLADTERHAIDLESGPAMPRAEFIKEREADRVLDCIEQSIAQQVLDGSFLLTSSEETHEFWVCVPVQYAAAADRAVVFEVQEVYTRAEAAANRQRPYFTRAIHYNVERPLRREPKLIFCTHFYFRFPNDPRIDAH